MAAEARAARRPSRLGRLFAVGVVMWAVGACGFTLQRVLEYRAALAELWGPMAVRGLTALSVVALGWSLIAAWTEIDPRRRESALARLPGTLLELPITSVLAWPLFLALVHPFERLWAELWLGPVSGGWALLHVLCRNRARLSRAVALLRRPALALAFALVGTEIALRWLDHVHPTRLTARVGEVPARILERFRPAPGTERFGFRCNSLGHFDDEPPSSGAARPWVAAIGDSFLVGAVPHAERFTTVAERELGLPIQDFGVSGVGPPEYLWMLVEEALPRDPRIVLWCLFVGNDLDVVDAEAERPNPVLRSILDRARVLWWQVSRRLIRIFREVRRADPVADADGRFTEAATKSPPPEAENPSQSRETFLDLEVRRARAICAADGAEFAALRRVLPLARRAGGARPFGVVLIPDEFQVEDPLWEEVVRRAGVPLERDRPQRLLRAWLAALDVPVLDLLPVLRSAPPLDDGRRHVYHLRDTHWNARGNRIAGLALAPFVRELLGP